MITVMFCVLKGFVKLISNNTDATREEQVEILKYFTEHGFDSDADLRNNPMLRKRRYSKYLIEGINSGQSRREAVYDVVRDVICPDQILTVPSIVMSYLHSDATEIASSLDTAKKNTESNNSSSSASSSSSLSSPRPRKKRKRSSAR